MKKKSIFVVAVALIALATLLTGCSFFTPKEETKTYKLIFMEVAGLDPIELDGSTINMPIPFRDGYVFDGWYVSKNGDVKFDQEYLETHPIKSNIKVYPKWVKIDNVLILLDPNGGEISLTGVTINKNVSTPQELGIPEGSGMEFLGWFTAPEGGEKVTGADGIIKNYSGGEVTLYAHWDVAHYTVTTALQGPDNATVSGGGTKLKFGEKVMVSTSIPNAERYIFCGWYIGDELQSHEAEYEHVVTGNAVLTAKWVGETVTVVYYRNYDASDDQRVIKNTQYGSTFTYLPDARTDYWFIGWYDNRECNGAPITGADGVMESVDPAGSAYPLYARWEKHPESTFALDFSVETDTYTVTGLNDDRLEVVHIPFEHNGIPVAYVAEGAFSACTGKTFVIPSTVVEIGANAFPANATIYVDNGANPDLITAPLFTSDMDIYFHLLTDTDNSLSDGRYAEADGRFITTEIYSMEDALSLYQYCFLYTVEEVTMHFNDSAYNGTDDGFKDTVINYFKNALNALGLKVNTSNSYSYSCNNHERTIRFVFTPEEKVATKKTNGADEQIQTHNINAVENGSAHDFAIDRMPGYYVTTTEQMIYAVERGYCPYFADKTAEPARVYAKAREILASIITQGMSSKEKLLRIHDWIALHTIYDTELYDMAVSGADLQAYRGFTSEGVFIDGRAVCDGNTKAFMLMARIEGIECIRVSGTARGTGHAWNKVKIEGEWYVVDVTSDDVLTKLNGGDKEYEVLRHEYFLVSDEQISATHVEADNSDAPEATGSYDYCGTNGYVYTTQRELNLALGPIVGYKKYSNNNIGAVLTFEFKVVGFTPRWNYIKDNLSCELYGTTANAEGITNIIVKIIG